MAGRRLSEGLTSVAEPIKALFERTVLSDELSASPADHPANSLRRNSMSQSPFDPAVFLDAQQTEVNERRPPLPVENPDDPNGLYTAQIGEITPKSGLIENGDRAGQNWAAMQVQLKIDVPPRLREEHKLPPQVTLSDMVFIDMTPLGQIDNAPGRNMRQKEYRDATGLNKKGESFSWRMLSGRPVKVKINQEMYNDHPVERLPKYGAIFPV